MMFEEMAKKANALVWSDLYAALMDKARRLALVGKLFTDNKDDWDENYQYLVADINDIIKAHYEDLAIQHIFGIDPSEGEDGPEPWCKRHGIEILG